MEERFELWALRRPFKGEEETVKVAIFFSEESAVDYLERSMLKKPTHASAYRVGSLLHGACDAWVVEAEDLPVDPVLPARVSR
jgi:hypothetical protein